MRLFGNFEIKDHTVRVADDAERTPVVCCHKKLSEKLRENPDILLELGMRRRSTVADLLLEATGKVVSDPSERLLFYSAQHPRQRLIIRDCRFVQTVKNGGHRVIVRVRTDSLLVFRHRDYVERVFFDGDRIIVRATQEESYL